MNKDLRKLLIVDDSEVDREVLKNILFDDFDIMEANNGYLGLECIIRNHGELDAVLLDVSMPVLDGFSVLNLMRQNKVDDIPIFLITAEATKENVERALEYNISEFIKKPFDREDVLKRLKERLGIVEHTELSEVDIAETQKYIQSLKEVYKRYLINFNKDVGHYARMEALMKILLSRYAVQANGISLERAEIDIISESVFFCDIGFMMIPSNSRGANHEEMNGEQYQSHTTLGGSLIRLNRMKQCEFFVHVCADICVHHHERFDGTGFPNRISGKNNSAYAQMCRLVDEFDYLFYKYREHNELQFDFVAGELSRDKGVVSHEIFQLLLDSKYNIVMYYSTV